MLSWSIAIAPFVLLDGDAQHLRSWAACQRERQWRQIATWDIRHNNIELVQADRVWREAGIR